MVVVVGVMQEVCEGVSLVDIRGWGLCNLEGGHARGILVGCGVYREEWRKGVACVEESYGRYRMAVLMLGSA